MPREDEDDLRWIRTGWFDQGRPVDELVAHLRGLWPDARKLPSRWAAANHIDFIQKYGPGVWLADTASYQMLVINGVPVFRMWHNAKSKALLECNNHLAVTLRGEGFLLEDIPAGSKAKRREFDRRTSVQLPEELTLITALVKDLYACHG